MNEEIKNIITEIREKTGINVAVYPESETKNSFVAAEAGEVVCDAEKGLTSFGFRYGGNKFTGCIAGAGETEKNYAELILSVIESRVDRENRLTADDYYRLALNGEISPRQVQRFSRRFSVPAGKCCAMAVFAPSERMKEVVAFLREYGAGESDAAVMTEDESCCAFIRFFPTSESEAFSSGKEFASIMAESLFEETGIKIRVGIGGAVSGLGELNASFREATEALIMSEDRRADGDNVHSYKEFVWTKMIEELPPARRGEFLSVLTGGDAGGVWDDEDMLATVDEFLECSLNVSETSRKLFMHRNTLMYRLDKVERLTGLDVRRFSDAVTFRLVTILKKLSEKTK